MSGDSSGDDGQGEEYLENDLYSAAGGKGKRVVVVNGIGLPKCRRGGCANDACACVRGELGRRNGTPLFPLMGWDGEAAKQTPRQMRAVQLLPSGHHGTQSTVRLLARCIGPYPGRRNLAKTSCFGKMSPIPPCDPSTDAKSPSSFKSPYGRGCYLLPTSPIKAMPLV
jgi:hypothetical protein